MSKAVLVYVIRSSGGFRHIGTTENLNSRISEIDVPVGTGLEEIEKVLVYHNQQQFLALVENYGSMHGKEKLIVETSFPVESVSPDEKQESQLQIVPSPSPTDTPPAPKGGLRPQASPPAPVGALALITPCCTRCGRNSHQANTCFARTNLRGEPLPPSTAVISPHMRSLSLSGVVCWTCGKPGHYSPQCGLPKVATGPGPLPWLPSSFVDEESDL